MEENIGKVQNMRYVKITSLGRVFLIDYLRGNIPQTEYFHSMAYLLTAMKRDVDSQGRSRRLNRIPGSLLLAYEGLLENKWIEEVEGDILDSIGDVVESRWRRLDIQEKESNWRAGLGPSPDMFRRFDDEEE